MTWHDRHQSIIDICEYHRIIEKYQSARGTIEQLKNPGCLGYIGDYTTQLCGDCNEPLYGSL